MKKAKPKRTIFSVDPKTGNPYLTVEDAMKMVYTHVNYHMPFLLKRNTMEELVSMYLEKACRSRYNPRKSAAKTWFTTILKTKGIQQYNYNKAKDRDKVCSDGYRDKNGEENYHSLTVLDDTTPLDYLLFKEFIVEWESSDTGKLPKGYRTIKDPIPLQPTKFPKRKKCNDCGITKRVVPHFSTKEKQADGISSACKKCVATASRKRNRDKKKALV